MTGVQTCALPILSVLNVLGYFYGWKYIGGLAAVAEVNKYQVRSELLMDAMNEVGVCSPEGAAEVWAKGLRRRSAALQYSVMSTELKEDYASQLEDSAPNWVAGQSSPWIQSFEIVSAEQSGEGLYVIELVFSTMTSTGPAGEHRAVLTIARDGDFWRITKISAEPELYPYTRYNPTL